MAVPAPKASRIYEKFQIRTMQIPYSIFFRESNKVFNAKVSFADLEFVHFSGQSQDTVSDNTGQGETIDGGSDEFEFTIVVLDIEEDVGSTDFSDLVISEPKNLVESLLFSFTRNHNSRTIVTI